ncbi:MAG TPA: hypothetical protein P5571_10535 [Candidatus Krumholzibacteria bacterium]|nr:hypothetical protein [Candidatus Krumholzibacteria bacterium]HRX51790.1 hypothetical protein [Candidatus Krumholzibacteria bacterium]
MTSRTLARTLPAVAAALLAAAALVPAPCRAQADLAPLFSAPTPAELADVAADWSARITVPSEYEIESTGSGGGFQVAGVRFVLNGAEQYGAVRYPRLYQPGGRYPVLLALHGGFDGLVMDWLLTFDETFPDGCVADSFFVVAPSFRGEVLNGQSVVGNRLGVGASAPFSFDADDAMGMLNAVLDLIPETDPLRVSAFARSRGGPAAGELLLRDPRVRRAVVLFGPSDFFLPHVQAGAQEFVDTGGTADRLGELVGERIAAPWLAGALTLAQARHLLLSWSVVPHVAAPLALQLHHGDLDDVVPVEHGRALAAALTAVGAAAPGFSYHEYPGGSHVPSSLTGYELRAEPYLCTLLDVTGTVPAPAPSRLIGAPNPFGEAVAVRVVPPLKDNRAPSIDVVDLRGRTVKQLRPSAGDTGAVRWDGRDDRGAPVPSGAYLLRPVDRPDLAPVRVFRTR